MYDFNLPIFPQPIERCAFPPPLQCQCTWVWSPPGSTERRTSRMCLRYTMVCARCSGTVRRHLPVSPSNGIYRKETGMWFRRKTRSYEVEPVKVHLGTLNVTHTVQKMPDPHPVRGHLTWTNKNGQQWRSQPFTISGNSSYPIDIPLAWITGRDADISELPAQVFLMLEF